MASTERYDFPFPVQIDNQMSQLHNFIFIGKTLRTDALDYDEILTTFDRLLPLYEFIEGNDDQHSTLGKAPAFVPGHKPRQDFTAASLPGGVVDVALRHNQLQSILYNLLSGRLGAERVREEHPLDYGGRVDVAVTGPNGLKFYEIKVAPSAKSAIREALRQLIEYSFWPDVERSSDLVVVAEPTPTPETNRYLRFLRNKLGLNVHYSRISSTPEKLFDPI